MTNPEQTVWSKLKLWERTAIAAFMAGMLALLVGTIIIGVESLPSRRPLPTPIPETRIEASVIEAADGITCVRVHRGQETLHWECLR